MRVGLSVPKVSSWRTDKRKTAERGYGWRWQQARETFLCQPENVLCRMCSAKGLIVVATVVDHVIPHKGDDRLFWDQTNWQALCKPCHDRDKQALERGKPDRMQRRRAEGSHWAR